MEIISYYGSMSGNDTIMKLCDQWYYYKAINYE